MSRGLARSGAALALAVAAIILFAGLGVWQLERRVGKLALIDRVNARVVAAPVESPGPDEWAGLTRDSSEYRRVRMRGHFLNGMETLVRAASELGYGYWVLTPFQTDHGYRVLVNRGFVAPERRDPASRSKGQIDGDTVVTGLLRISEPGGGFLRSNDPARDRWYSRDVAAIASARGVSDVAPYFVDADATGLPDAPTGGLTIISFPNNHLSYALTWFALSGLSAAAALFLWREGRRDRGRLKIA